MSTSTVLIGLRYAKLLKDIRKLIEEGKSRSIQAANQELIAAYWNVGRRITKEGLTANAGYGDSVMSSLSEDLGIDRNMLYQVVVFLKQNKVCPRAENLTWSHYKHLRPINGGKGRGWYEGLAEEDGRNAAQLSKRF